jgi:hypothetical protein
VLRRFVTPDPHVTDPLDGQSYNRYSYVANDPVNRTDPTGFDWWDGSLGCIGMECLGGPGYISGGFGFGLSFSCGSGGATTNAGTGGTSMPRFASGGPVLGSSYRAVSVPTGPSAPAMAAAGPSVQAWAEDQDEESWRDLPAAQGMRGLIRGLIGGIVPGAGFADQVWSETGRLPQGSRNERIGRAIGEIIGGGLTTFLGAGGEIAGIGLFATGGGAPLGAMAMAASAGAVTAGLVNMGAGMRGLTQALMMDGGGDAAGGAGTPATSVADHVMAEARFGSGNFTSTHSMTADEALHAGEQWVGSGHGEMGGSGIGVLRSPPTRARSWATLNASCGARR